jgi:hypothetical protein
MQGTRIVIDGLWRCLCPSVDTFAVSQLNSSVRRGSIRPSLPPTRRRLSGLSRSSLSRSIHGKANVKLQCQGYGTAAEGCETEGCTTLSAVPKSTPSHASFDDVPVTELHDALRHTGTKGDAYKSISDLVEYLIKFRGEKPSLLHYDALVRANADVSKGSADGVASLLREVKEENIKPDSNLYHSALQVYSMAQISPTLNKLRLLIQFCRLLRPTLTICFVMKSCEK